MLDELTQQVTLKKRELDNFVEESALIDEKITQKRDEFSKVQSELDAQIKTLTDTKEILLRETTELAEKLSSLTKEVTAAEEYKKQIYEETATALDERNATIAQVTKDIEELTKVKESGVMAAKTSEEDLAKREGDVQLQKVENERMINRIEQYRVALGEKYGTQFDSFLDWKPDNG